MISTSSKTRLGWLWLGIHETKQEHSPDNGLLLSSEAWGKKFDELRFLIFVVDSGKPDIYHLKHEYCKIHVKVRVSVSSASVRILSPLDLCVFCVSEEK